MLCFGIKGLILDFFTNFALPSFASISNSRYRILLLLSISKYKPEDIPYLWRRTWTAWNLEEKQLIRQKYLFSKTIRATTELVYTKNQEVFAPTSMWCQNVLFQSQQLFQVCISFHAIFKKSNMNKAWTHYYWNYRTIKEKRSKMAFGS